MVSATPPEMSLVQVICTSEDVSFVEGWLLPPLGPLGYDRVVGPQPMVDSRSVIQPGAVVLVVVPEIGPGDDSGHFLEEVTAAMAAGNPVLPIYRRSPDTGDPSRVLRELAGLAWIDARPPTSRHRLWRRLARLLPRPDPAPVAENAEIGTPIRWNAEAFSVLLHVCAERNDFEIGEVLVEAFARYAGNLTAGDRTGHGDPASRAKPYTDEDVEGDLRLLESERQFLLMRRYAEAAVRSGTTNFTVRRRYAQALIELKDFAGADDVLDSLLQETTAVGHPERFEARGLRGRMYKQRYVDAGEHAAGEWLTRAIATYWEAFSEHRNNVWHGVNAASCLRRAVRDGVPTPPGVPSPEWIARRILQILDELQREAAPRQLGVWECATRVEAYLDLEDFDRAADHLAEYLGHPGVETFTVSSTYRQFDEVLQLRRDPRGRPILDRLGRAAERLRTGGLKGVEDADAAHLLVRVADPAWPPAAIPGPGDPRSARHRPVDQCARPARSRSC